MICGGFYAGASPRRSLRPKGIDLRGRWFAPAQNTLATAKRRRIFYVGLPTYARRGLFELGSSPMDSVPQLLRTDKMSRQKNAVSICRLALTPLARSILLT